MLLIPHPKMAKNTVSVAVAVAATGTEFALQIQYGGEEGIRTLDTGEGIHAFQACALGHYATSPY